MRNTLKAAVITAFCLLTTGSAYAQSTQSLRAAFAAAEQFLAGYGLRKTHDVHIAALHDGAAKFMVPLAEKNYVIVAVSDQDGLVIDLLDSSFNEVPKNASDIDLGGGALIEVRAPAAGSYFVRVRVLEPCNDCYYGVGIFTP